MRLVYFLGSLVCNILGLSCLLLLLGASALWASGGLDVWGFEVLALAIAAVVLFALSWFLFTKYNGITEQQARDKVGDT